MKAAPKTLIRAILTMVGTIIGAGIFGVPAVMAQVGVAAGSIIFWGVWLIVLSTHLLFFELMVDLETKLIKSKSNKKRYRMPGYVAAVLGPRAKNITAVVQSLGLVGSNFAYLILGGEFLSLLLGSFGTTLNPLIMQIVFWSIGATAILLSLRVMAKVESIFTWGLLVILIFLIGSSIVQADISRFVVANWESAFVPIGIFLFALYGMTIIPEVFEITGRRIERTRKAILIGSFTAALLTWLFGIFVSTAIPLGISQNSEAMVQILPAYLWWVLPLLGLLAVLTSFITSAFNLRMTYSIDLGQSRAVARFVSLGIPLILLFIAPTDLLRVLDIVGIYFSGGLALIIVLAAFVSMNNRKDDYSFWWRSVTPIITASFFIIVMLQRFAALN